MRYMMMVKADGNYETGAPPDARLIARADYRSTSENHKGEVRFAHCPAALRKSRRENAISAAC